METLLLRIKVSKPVSATAAGKYNFNLSFIFYVSISVLENTGVDHSIYTFAVAETSGKLIVYTIVSGNEKGESYFISDLKELR